MDIQQELQQRKSNDHSLGYFHGEAATTSVESGSIAYQAPSLVVAGMNAQGVQLASSALCGVMALLCIKVPSMVGKTKGAKKTATVLAFANILTWIPVAVVFFFFMPINPIWLAMFWLLNLIPSILIAPLRDSWLVDTVPQSSMRQYLGMRSAISAGTYLIAFCSMGYLLELSNGQALFSFAIVFTVGTLSALGSFFFYSRIKPNADSATTQNSDSGQRGADFGIIDFIKEMRKGYLGTIILYASLFNLAVFISKPLLAVYILEELHMGYFVFMALICSEFLAKIVGAMFWRRYTGTNNNLGIICKVSPFICLAPILWLFSSNLVYLALVQALTGVMWAGFELSYNVLIYEAAPQEKRLSYICYSKTFNTISMALGSLAAACLVVFMFPVMGSKILGLFLISGIIDKNLLLVIGSI